MQLRLPVDLQQAIDDAKRHLGVHHALWSAQRQAIYACLGPWGENDVETIGYRRRTRLAIHSVQRVLPLLELYVPNSRSKDLLCLAEHVLAGKTDRLHIKIEYLLHSLAWQDEDPQTFKAISALYRTLGPLSADDAYTTVEQVAIAAHRALGVALMDEFNTPKLLKERPETTPDYWASDAAGCAWVAYREKDGMAHGKQAIRNGDEFWLWWLTVAIPYAWEDSYRHKPT